MRGGGCSAQGMLQGGGSSGAILAEGLGPPRRGQEDSEPFPPPQWPGELGCPQQSLWVECLAIAKCGSSPSRMGMQLPQEVGGGGICSHLSMSLKVGEGVHSGPKPELPMRGVCGSGNGRTQNRLRSELLGPQRWEGCQGGGRKTRGERPLHPLQPGLGIKLWPWEAVGPGP